MRGLPLDVGTIHFVGIGGIGMSGMAELLVKSGYCVPSIFITHSPIN